MGVFQRRRFYSSEEEFAAIRCTLLTTFCPFCKKTGTLILHGYLTGYAQHSPAVRIRRGRRIICTRRRNRNNGCGKTFSMHSSRFIPRLWYTTDNLWHVIRCVANGTPVYKLAEYLCTARKTVYRLFVRFRQAQHKIRSLLCTITDPPSQPDTTHPYKQTIRHLQTTFSSTDAILEQFHLTFQVPII